MIERVRLRPDLLKLVDDAQILLIVLVGALDLSIEAADVVDVQRVKIWGVRSTGIVKCRRDDFQDFDNFLVSKRRLLAQLHLIEVQIVVFDAWLVGLKI